MERAELELFERSVANALDERAGVDAALVEMGWQEAFESHPGAAVRVLFTQLGRTNATSSALTWVVGSSVLPPLGSCDQPGVGGRFEGLGLGPRIQTAVAGGTVCKVESCTVTPIAGLDPTLGLAHVAGTIGSTGDPVDWPAQVALGQVAIGHQLIGAARAMLELACDHARERSQFGRAISSFQAVRHRFADTLVAIEAADALLDAAWEDKAFAPMAKATAGRSARTAARHCQQVLAGIGFTAEHPLHRYVRRAFVLDQLLGRGRALSQTLGEQIVTDRVLPGVIRLLA
jgi:hypothetical protein